MQLAQSPLHRTAGTLTIQQTDRSALREAALPGAYVLLLAASYFLAARLGLGFRFYSSQVGVIWPANAVLVSALLLTSRRHWWVVLLTTAMAHGAVMFEVVPAWRWTWQIASNSIFATMMVEALRRWAGLPLHFGSRRQVTVYAFVSFATAALCTITMPTFIRTVLQLESTFSPSTAFLRAFLSIATAFLLVPPVVVLWAQYGRRRLTELSRKRVTEAVFMTLSLVAVGEIIFLAGPEIARFPSLLLWIVPPLLWAAVRFGPLGAASTLFCCAALSVWGTSWQLGPFVLTTTSDQVLSLQLFWIVLCAPVLLLAAAIREREQAEHALHEQRNQLAHVTRVATVGELSGAFAHELRQPLTSILANAQAAIRMLSSPRVDPELLREILTDITKQDIHAASVLSRLQSFLKQGTSQFETVTIENLVRDALALGRSAIQSARVNVQTEIAGIPQVHGDPVQLLQVLLNLIVNGCEAMRSKPVTQRRLQINVTSVDHRHVEVVIADAGVGLPDGVEERVFEPFFTTKDHGLGLGLAIGRSIVRAHGGRLWGENNSQGGASFHLILPSQAMNGAH